MEAERCVSFLVREEAQVLGMVAEAASIGVTLEHYQSMHHVCVCAGLLSHGSEAAMAFLIPTDTRWQLGPAHNASLNTCVMARHR